MSKILTTDFLDNEERLRNSSSSLNPTIVVVVVVAPFMNFQDIGCLNTLLQCIEVYYLSNEYLLVFLVF